MKFLVYVDTLDPVTYKIERNWKPIGYVIVTGIQAGRELARSKFHLRPNQRPYLHKDPYTVNKILGHFRAAEREHKPIGFSEAYERMKRRRRGGAI